jgi:ribosomal protein S27E
MVDTVRIMCPNLTCRRVLAVPTSARGKTVRCKNCGTTIRVPMAGENMKDIKLPDKKSA